VNALHLSTGVLQAMSTRNSGYEWFLSWSNFD
jgi:hypothetical protein